MGNKAATFATLAASSHGTGEREINDYYATEPKAVELLLEKEKFNMHILEPSCGEGHISNVLVAHDYDVQSYDLIDRGYGGVQDFFNIQEFNGDIITNPPYKVAAQFAQHAIDIVPIGNKVAMFLKLQFLEGKARRKFFNSNPPKTVYVASGRLNCAKNGEFYKYTSSAVAYAWFVWEKGYTGKPEIEWIN
ncbi:NAD(P)-dependent oxidoreductase [Weissella confusa]|nr:NAD(P)-dependent oxidoreductase [Weissella confusa]